MCKRPFLFTTRFEFLETCTVHMNEKQWLRISLLGRQPEVQRGSLHHEQLLEHLLYNSSNIGHWRMGAGGAWSCYTIHNAWENEWCPGHRPVLSASWRHCSQSWPNESSLLCRYNIGPEAVAHHLQLTQWASYPVTGPNQAALSAILARQFSWCTIKGHFTGTNTHNGCDH